MARWTSSSSNGRNVQNIQAGDVIMEGSGFYVVDSINWCTVSEGNLERWKRWYPEVKLGDEVDPRIVCHKVFSTRLVKARGNTPEQKSAMWVKKITPENIDSYCHYTTTREQRQKFAMFVNDLRANREQGTLA